MPGIDTRLTLPEDYFKRLEGLPRPLRDRDVFSTEDCLSETDVSAT
jgi:hypothetical protein